MGESEQVGASAQVEPVGLLPMDEQELAELLREDIDDEDPQAFAIYEVAPDRQDAWMWGLGVATRDQVILQRRRSGVLCSYHSIQQIFDRWGRRRELRLLWAAGDAPKWTVERDGDADDGLEDESDGD